MKRRVAGYVEIVQADVVAAGELLWSSITSLKLISAVAAQFAAGNGVVFQHINVQVYLALPGGVTYRPILRP